MSNRCRLLRPDDLEYLKVKTDCEKEQLFYTYLTARRSRCSFAGLENGNREIRHAAGYLSGMPFQAFAFLIGEEMESAQTGDLVRMLAEQNSLSGTGTTMVQPHELPVVMNELDIVSPPRRQFHMKLADRERLMRNPEAIRLSEGHRFYTEQFASELDMIAFTKEQSDSSPLYGIFRNDELAALGGFHVYDTQIMEIGNIGTLPEYRGQGLAKDVTSALVHEALKHSGEVYLYVFADNTEAVSLYESLGFEIAGERFFTEFRI
ncbi:GNAT family N-acetyltransferase [Alteribacter natronophilus]|uniref:GNAT family N-acetyltransferase n=1 Tax=Alteribacter natronophilus TaxID=2583810 RepID=UPI00110F3D26|nr:GNAT family N-acetyltransferase [Alteribacter natronophilus]TMW70297.1 GNAT family N-acetyltransferase [Alteribacter natronophilus]